MNRKRYILRIIVRPTKQGNYFKVQDSARVIPTLEEMKRLLNAQALTVDAEIVERVVS